MASQKRRTVAFQGQKVDIEIVKVHITLRKARGSIAEAHQGNNVPANVIHRRWNRQSCVFHSIHRFSSVLTKARINATTCGYMEQERMFAP